MEEKYFFIYMIVAVVVIFGGIALDDWKKTEAMTSMIQSGVDPIKARCAVYGENCEQVNR